MNEPDKEQRNYDSIRDYRDRSFKNAFYSIQRIDLIIISLSTGGIVALLNYLKDVILINNEYLSNIFFNSILLFVLTIIFNIASQFTSYKSNEIEGNWAHQELKRKNGVSFKTMSDNTTLEIITMTLNYVSIAVLVIAMTLFLMTIWAVLFNDYSRLHLDLC